MRRLIHLVYTLCVFQGAKVGIYDFSSIRNQLSFRIVESLPPLTRDTDIRLIGVTALKLLLIRFVRRCLPNPPETAYENLNHR